jgi:hypothetical protein
MINENIFVMLRGILNYFIIFKFLNILIGALITKMIKGKLLNLMLHKFLIKIKKITFNK